ncbi:MAG: MFS transporter [Bryobacteraceae bacterium]|jgi:MFS transporter, ACS family, D-galactonate transporter
MSSAIETTSHLRARETLIRRRWWIAALLFFAGLINYFDRTIVSVALPAIAADLHLGPTRMGVLLSAFFWSYALMQVPIGWLSDRFNLRWLYAGCFALWSITCGLTGFVASLGFLLLLRVLLGIGESIYLPGGMKIVSILFPPKDRGLASGLVNCGTRAGLAFGAPLIAAVVVAFGWKNAFFILGFTSLVWLIPWVAAFPRGANTAEYGEPSAAKATWGKVDRNLLGMSITNIGYGYYFYLMVTWLPTYLVQARHLPLKVAAAYVVVPYVTFAVSEPIGGWIADRLVAIGWEETFARKTIVTAAFLTSILLIPAGLVADTNSAVFLLGGASLVGLSSGNLYATVQRISFGRNVGFSVGVFNLAGNISGVVAPLVTGLIVDETGSYFPAFVLAVTILLAVLPAYWLMVKTARPRTA